MSDATGGDPRNKKAKRDKQQKVKVGGDFKAKVSLLVEARQDDLADLEIADSLSLSLL